MEKDTEYEPVALWDPIWINIWSVIFSPGFGGFLQRRNWEEIGDWKKVVPCGKWFGISATVLIIYLLVEPFLPETPITDYFFFIVWFALYFIWLYCRGLPHVREIKALYGTNYYHKRWGRPFFWGVIAWILWISGSITYIIILVALGAFKL